MAVGINPLGSEQILNFLSTDFALHYGTHARGFADLANKYFNYFDPTINPHNSELDCQTTAIILIGDGEWKDDTHRYAKSKISSLFRTKKSALTVQSSFSNQIALIKLFPGIPFESYKDLFNIKNTKKLNLILTKILFPVLLVKASR